MHVLRAVELSAQMPRRRLLHRAALGITVACVASSLALASAEEKPARQVDVNWPLPVIRPGRVQHVEYTEKRPAQVAPAPAPAVRAAVQVAAPLRQEGKVLIGTTNMLVDGIRIGIELSRLEEPPGDAEQDPDAPPEPWQQVQIQEGAFDRVLFVGNGLLPLGKLEELLDQEMKLVESVRPLELDQRRKLRLAARGDMHRVLQEIDDLRPKFDQTWTAPESESRRPIMEVSALMKEATRVRNLLVMEAFRADSRFDKNLRKLVTDSEYVMIVNKRNQTVAAPRIRKGFRDGSGR